MTIRFVPVKLLQSLETKEQAFTELFPRLDQAAVIDGKQYIKIDGTGDPLEGESRPMHGWLRATPV